MLSEQPSREVYIHIGLPKSASSYLQEYLFPLLQEKNLLNFINVQAADELVRMIVFQDDFSYEEDKIRNELDSYFKDGINVLTVEWFSGVIDFKMFNTVRTATRLQSLFPSAKYILILRNQVDFIYSAYKQHIHQGGSMSLRNFLNYQNNEFYTGYKHPLYSFTDYKFNFNGLHYPKLIQLYQERSLGIFLFEEFISDFDSFISRLLQYLKIDNSLPVPNKLINKGYGRVQIGIARLINPLFSSIYNKYGFKIFPKWLPFFGSLSTHHIRVLLQSKLSFKIFGQTSIRDEKISSMIREMYRSHNKEMLGLLDEEYSPYINKFYL